MPTTLPRGPGFSQRVYDELKRIDPRLDLVWCSRRVCWCVVRRAPDYERCWWNGAHHPGYTMLLRWLGLDGEYDPSPYLAIAEPLPLDDRLLARVRMADPAHHEDPAQILRDIEAREFKDSAKAKWLRERAQRLRDVERAAEPIYTGRVVSVPGLAPGFTRLGGPLSGGFAGLKRRR
jgi:hypothetical protein